MMKRIIAIFVLAFFAKSLTAQMLKPTSGFILSDRYDSSLTLKKGEYIVQGEVVIGKDAVITIDPGVKIFFMPGGTISVMGGLHVNGEANNLVQFSSEGGKESGTGLVINSSNPKTDIKINYASFKYLLKPLDFEKDWYRSGVDITNSDFFNTYEFNDAVSVKEVEFYLNKQPIEFNFKGNVFADNYSNISVYNATSYRVKYTFEKNVFANNLYFDSRTKAESNPIYAGLDVIEGKYMMKIYNNAFSDNFIFTQDSLKQIDYGTIGTLHPTQEFVTINNFSKDSSVEKNYNQNEPNYGLHAFSLDLSSNGKKISQKTPVDSLVSKNIKVRFNTPIAAKQPDYKVFFNFVDTITGEILKKQIDKNYTFNNAANNEADFSFDSSVITEPIGYVSIENLKNADGVSVPSVNLGIIDFFEKYGSRSHKPEVVTLAPVDVHKKNLKLVDTVLNFIIPIDSTRLGKWEVGLFAGVSGYGGDLNHQWYQEKWNLDYALKVRRYIDQNFSVKGVIEYTNVGAKDYGLYARRALSFKSKILDAYVMGEYSFSDKNIFKYKNKNQKKNFTLGRKIYPTLGVGVGLLKFNPMGQYVDGKWYALRDLGTEGQTAPGGKKYKLMTLSIPMMVSMNYRVTSHIKVAIEFTALKLFTDYLDDVSIAKYVPEELVRTANPANPDVAAYFRNPGKSLGARGNAQNKDFVYSIGLNLAYRFNKK